MSGADDRRSRAVGRVLDEGRGSLPFALVHGEALVACATWALSEAGVLPLDARTSLRGASSSPTLPLVLHDSLCPMTPPAFIEPAYAGRSPRARRWSGCGRSPTP